MVYLLSNLLRALAKAMADSSGLGFLSAVIITSAALLTKVVRTPRWVPQGTLRTIPHECTSCPHPCVHTT